MSEFFIPQLSYEHLREKAEEFFSKYHPSKKCPLPIEEIIEFSMKINIVPMPGLLNAIDGDQDGFEVDGYISSDLTEITVDEYIWKNRANRYRFTLAHEVGHFMLHRFLYEPRRFNTIEEWKNFYREMPMDACQAYEWQASSFAGLILVPQLNLEDSVDKHLRGVVRIMRKNQIAIDSTVEAMMWDIILQKVADDFQVSTGVIQKRVRFDGLDERALFAAKLQKAVAEPLID